jgi:hypothetical protein
LVALATCGERPMKIIAGKVTALPLLATVFNNPPKNPARISNNKFIMSIEFYNILSKNYEIYFCNIKKCIFNNKTIFIIEILINK